MRLRDYHKIDTQLAITIFGLSLFGLLMLYSASAELSRVRTGDTTNSTHYLILQIISFIIGLVLWLVLQQVDYRRYKPLTKWWLLTTFVLLISVSFFSKGEVNGAHRWVSILGQTFQPSELAKLSFILFLAGWFSQKERDWHSWQKGLAPFLMIIIIMSALMLKQRDLGTLGVMVTIALAMYAMSGARLAHIGATIGSMFAIGWVAIIAAPYRLQRFLSFLNADASPQGAGYHVNQAKIAIGLGGVWGKGLLQGSQKKGFLPEAHTDSIFAVIVEELGFLRSSIVVLAFLFIGVRGLRIARYAPDTFGSLVAVGITTWFVAQALINVAAMVSLIPLTGVPLPFISYGRTAMIALFMATGIILNISRYAEE